MGKMIIRYCPEGVAVSDFEVYDTLENLVDRAQDEETIHVHYSTENIFAAIRLKIVLGEISYNDVIFEYGLQPITVNEYGVLSTQPHGFCVQGLNTSRDIVIAVAKKRRNQRLGEEE